MFGEFVRAQPCPRCSGAGRTIEQPCEDCEGSGRVVERRTLAVEIPPGIHDGQRIGSRARATSAAGAPAGDVYVRVRVKPDARFVREGDDIYSTLDLTIAEAALGTTRTVETLSGESELTFQAGTQPGEVRVLSVAGCPCSRATGAGTTGCSSTSSSRAPLPGTAGAARGVRAQHRAENYRPDEGFFDKLKSAFR